MADVLIEGLIRRGQGGGRVRANERCRGLGLAGEGAGQVRGQRKPVSGEVVEQDEALLELGTGRGVVEKDVLFVANPAAAQHDQGRQREAPLAALQVQRAFLLRVGQRGAAMVPMMDALPAAQLKGRGVLIAAQRQLAPERLRGQLLVELLNPLLKLRQIVHGLEREGAVANGLVAPAHQGFEGVEPRGILALAARFKTDEDLAQFGHQQLGGGRQAQHLRGQNVAQRGNPVAQRQHAPGKEAAPHLFSRHCIAMREQIAGHHQGGKLDQHLGQVLELENSRDDLALLQQLAQALVFMRDGAGPVVGNGGDPGRGGRAGQCLALGDGLGTQGRGIAGRLVIGQDRRGVTLTQGLHGQHDGAAIRLWNAEIGQFLAVQFAQARAVPAGVEQGLGMLWQLQAGQPIAQTFLGFQLGHGRVLLRVRDPMRARGSARNGARISLLLL